VEQFAPASIKIATGFTPGGVVEAVHEAIEAVNTVGQI
jgi:hypothetical protein